MKRNVTWEGLAQLGNNKEAKEFFYKFFINLTNRLSEKNTLFLFANNKAHPNQNKKIFPTHPRPILFDKIFNIVSIKNTL